MAEDEFWALTPLATLTPYTTLFRAAPVAVADANTLTEDTASVSGNVLTNDTDADDGATLTVEAGYVRVSITGTVGTRSLAANGRYSYQRSTAGGEPLAQADSVTDSF